ncbi:hypothetical protein, unlikely [Trypanosoma congolense IL3000]|uniref:Uncharacterized protein n=1 Tax=Trypanosoma congolense (strain IL3000) TaxID=1068625 RepID=F9W5Z3_TRYCI|nr:hypothetical protein, unlikely [Trypanosoma congolense IL3000]
MVGPTITTTRSSCIRCPSLMSMAAVALLTATTWEGSHTRATVHTDNSVSNWHYRKAAGTTCSTAYPYTSSMRRGLSPLVDAARCQAEGVWLYHQALLSNTTTGQPIITTTTTTNRRCRPHAY